MSRTVYCAGEFVAEAHAHLSIFDRGFLFADAIYEVTAVLDGRMIDNDLHLDRLERSLSALGMPMPAMRDDIEQIQGELIRRNALNEGIVYMQVSRGRAERSFTYPEGLEPTLVVFTQVHDFTHSPKQARGISVQLRADERWARRDIKTTMLLSQVMAKQQAKAAGHDDAWLVEDGLVTEGASGTAFIVTAQGDLVTRAHSNATLPGCTRQAVLRLCAEHDLKFEERAFTPAEAQAAREAFVTSASSFVTPVVRLDDSTIGAGTPGPLTRQLQTYYLEAARGTDQACTPG